MTVILESDVHPNAFGLLILLAEKGLF